MAVQQSIVQTPFGATLFRDSDIGNTVSGVKSASTTIHAILIDNTANAATTFVKLYNVTSGSVTIGTTAPDMIIPIPASSKRTLFFLEGLIFGTALTAAAVTAGGTAGTTSPTSDVALEILYV